MVGLDTMHMESLSGDHIEKMTEQQLAQVAPGISVFYRVTPRHKLCIVKVSSPFNIDSINLYLGTQF
jgi:magnesium-transporting ATPase (P-type)